MFVFFPSSSVDCITGGLKFVLVRKKLFFKCSLLDYSSVRETDKS